MKLGGARWQALPHSARLLSLGVSLTLALLLVSAFAIAEDVRGFRILSAETQLQDGLYRLDADAALRLTDDVLEALDNGVPITIEFEARVEAKREYLWNRTDAVRTWQYQLRYHSLTQRHVITDLLTGDRHSYRARHAALLELGRLHGLPLIPADQLEPGKQYVVRLRVGIDIEALPAPLRLPAYLSNQWDLESDWYEWPLV